MIKVVDIHRENSNNTDKHKAESQTILTPSPKTHSPDNHSLQFGKYKATFLPAVLVILIQNATLSFGAEGGRETARY